MHKNTVQAAFDLLDPFDLRVSFLAIISLSNLSVYPLEIKQNPNGFKNLSGESDVLNDDDEIKY